jgi:hypothetical protein
MKISGALILAIGLLLTYYTAITNVSQADYAEPSKPALSMTAAPASGWQSYVGIGVTILGSLFIYRGEERM